MNTIIKDPSTGKLRGDNTDWIGIRDAVCAKLRKVERKHKTVSPATETRVCSPSTSHANVIMNVTMDPGTLLYRGNGPAYLPSIFADSKNNSTIFVPKVGLVIGAGGTARAACFALVQMGCQDIRIFNRTKSKAVALAKEFANACAVDQLNSNEGGSLRGVEIVLCTVPATAQFVLPTSIWAASNPPPRVVLDAAYRPRETRLLEQARIEGKGSSEAGGVARVEGIDMLIMQGFGALRLWTGQSDLTPAVRAAVTRSVMQYYAESA